jgi:predicted dehydrogenase
MNREVVMEKTLQIGILGAGYIGGVHAKALSSIEGVRIAAICSTPKETADSLADALSHYAPTIYDDFDAMLLNESLDALYVCLPPFAHAGQVEKAAAQGIHLFIEKPLGLTSVQARAMAKAVNTAGVIGQVGYHMRFGTAVEQLKAKIQSGEAGIPTLFDAIYACNSLHGSWWRQKEKSGGQVLEQAIHLYDMALYLLGTPRSVSGHIENLCHTDVPNYTIEDTSASLIRFESGAIATIAASNCAVPMEWSSRFTVVCGTMTAVFTDENHAVFIHTNGDETKQETICGSVNPYLQESKAFIEAIRTGLPSLASLDDGALGVQVVESVFLSSASNGSPIAINHQHNFAALV